MRGSILILGLVAMVMCSSCKTLKVVTKVPFKVEKKGEVALVTVMIDKVRLPVFPLIDAAMYNKRTRSIADILIVEEKNKAAEFRDSLGRRITEQFGFKVLSKELTQARMDSAGLVHIDKPLETGNKHFPTTLLPEGERNPIDFPKGDFPAFFINPVSLKKGASLCNLLKVDAVAFSYSYLEVTGVTAYGLKGSVLMRTEFYMIGKDGQMLAEGYGVSETTSITGNYVSEYTSQLDNFNYLNENMLKDMSGIPFKKK